MTLSFLLPLGRNWVNFQFLMRSSLYVKRNYKYGENYVCVCVCVLWSQGWCEGNIYCFINPEQRSNLPTKVHLVKAMVFPVVMYGCESWTVKKAERRRIDAFELWCWRRLLRVPWSARISNQSILKEISAGCSLEGLMLKLKLQYFGHLMRRADSLEKILMLGKIEGRRRRGRQDEMVGWHHWLNGHGFGWTPGVGDGQGDLVCCSSWGHKESDMTEWLNWTDTYS